MEVELRKSEVSALAELKELCRHECTAERCADAVREFGWSLEHVPEDMKTPEMCRRALEASAELGYGHLALLHHIPFAEVCMEAMRDWYGDGRADLHEVASAIRPEVFDGKMADFLVAEDGRCLSLLPVHLQTPERAEKAVEVSGASALLSDRVKLGLKTPELWRKCAEHGWMSFVAIPWRERSPEACLTAYLNYPDMIRAHPHVVPQPVESYCNVYSLCRLMEQMTGEKFTYGQMADFYGGKPMAVKYMDLPEGLLKDREVTFDRQKEKFRIAPISQKEAQKEEQKQGERQRQERDEAPKRRGGMKI